MQALLTTPIVTEQGSKLKETKPDLNLYRLAKGPRPALGDRLQLHEWLAQVWEGALQSQQG
jgi:hypothetical protein